MKATVHKPKRPKPKRRCPGCKGEPQPVICGNRAEWGCLRCGHIVEDPPPDFFT